MTSRRVDDASMSRDLVLCTYCVIRLPANTRAEPPFTSHEIEWLHSPSHGNNPQLHTQESENGVSILYSVYGVYTTKIIIIIRIRIIYHPQLLQKNPRYKSLHLPPILTIAPSLSTRLSKEPRSPTVPAAKPCQKIPAPPKKKIELVWVPPSSFRSRRACSRRRFSHGMIAEPPDPFSDCSLWPACAGQHCCSGSAKWMLNDSAHRAESNRPRLGPAVAGLG
jgi:hypothetical protein